MESALHSAASLSFHPNKYTPKFSSSFDVLSRLMCLFRLFFLFMCTHAVVSLRVYIFAFVLVFFAIVRVIQVAGVATWSSSGWSEMTFRSLCYYRDSQEVEVWVIRMKMRKDLSAAGFFASECVQGPHSTPYKNGATWVNPFCQSLFWSSWNKCPHSAVIRLVNADNTECYLQSGSGFRQQQQLHMGTCYTHPENTNP